MLMHQFKGSPVLMKPQSEKANNTFPCFPNIHTYLWESNLNALPLDLLGTEDSDRSDNPYLQGTKMQEGKSRLQGSPTLSALQVAFMYNMDGSAWSWLSDE